MQPLVLSLFPGGGLLDYAFEAEGFCVVRGPDVLWGGDIRRFHPPLGRFDGIIGGDPCQSHSSLANLVRAKGLEPSFPDMTPEYQRVVDEASPKWFLRENVPKAPDITPAGYDVRSFMLCNSTLDSGDGTGNEQMRKRKWWFGVRDGECPELRAFIDFALFELPDAATAVGGHDGFAPQKSVAALAEERKRDLEENPDQRRGSDGRRLRAIESKNAKQPPVTGRHEGADGTPDIDYSPPRRTLDEMLRLQGLPEDWLKHQPWTMQAKRKVVGNGVAVPMGRALAKAVMAAMEKR